jgi:AcrR family transcriptional regulator
MRRELPRAGGLAPGGAKGSPARRRGRPAADAHDEASRRQQLLRAAARLFREQGYHGTTVRDIASATGLQSGSWVYHFPTKQEMLVAVMEQGLDEALARIEAIVSLHLAPRAQFEALVRTHLETILQPGQDFVPVLLYEWRSLERGGIARVTAPLKRYEMIWSRAIRELQAAGAWPAPTRIDALLLFGALNWIARWYDTRGAYDIDTLAAECVRFFLRTPRRAGRRGAATSPRRAAKRRSPA